MVKAVELNINIITIIICLLSVGTAYGVISQQIKILTKAVEKHNNVLERLYVAEERGNSNTHRIDNLEEKMCKWYDY